MSAKLRATVVSVQVDPLMRHRLLRHLVRVRVGEVLHRDDEPISIADELNLLIHSPVMTFPDLDPVGREYVLTLDDPLTEPYAGTLVVEPPHD